MVADGEPLLDLCGWSLTQRRPEGPAPLLTEVNLTLRRGEWIAVAGANGTGKSSLLTWLAGAGSPLRASAALLPQDPDDQFVAATVAGELALGRFGDVAAPAGFGLSSLMDQDPRLLSAGQKQRLALALALGTRPDVLLCDEPTALQDAGQAAWVLDRIDAWRRESGGAVLSATCDRREAERADELIILDQGRMAARGAPATLLADPRWLALFADDRAAVAGAPAGLAGGPSAGAPLLSLRGVGCRFTAGGFSGVDLDLGPGSRLGLCGDNGCGKSTLLAVCAGARRPDVGEVHLGGHRLYSRRGLDTGHGRALLAPQFPEYLFSRSTVAQELAVDPVLAVLDVPGFLKELGLPATAAGRHPRDLSCGQRRRLALGLVLRSGRHLLLVDEPTVALDGEGRRLVARLMAELPQTAAVVVASHDHRFLERIGCEVMRLESGGLRSMPAPVSGTST